ncbi:alginate lyase family protein [Streptomyces sp. DR7-3]|uniref:alginate lyase family protein n=1 Tax=Streptomyces malaysiensis TaxID=92644 RepID=UPI002043EA19|nr:alginate lyase family protein [Streptomyces sp. DR7-3]MCM3805362.1 alginate lyase family protein [Streptomyces sp. DR7-3]
MGAPPAGRGRLARAIIATAALLAVLAIPSAPSAQGAERAPHAGPVPRTVVLDGPRLSLTKLKLQLGDEKLRRTVRDLTTRADRWMEQGPWTVTDKDQVPPSGDKHDYFSQAPYWWPSRPKTEDNPYGCPYVQKDGQRNPDVDKMTDRPEVGKVFESAYELSLAWYYTGERAYAEHAADILRTWFVTPATRMNPNLDHAQFIPCQYDGRSIGIIDFSQAFTSLLDAAALLDTGAPGWSKSDHEGFRGWNEQFLDWLVNSDFGKEEGAAENNHGTFYDMQIAAIATAVGDRDLARQVLRDARAKRIDTQIAADGTQPQELARTRSFHYSTFNLVAYTRMAAIGEHIGVDLWHYTGPGGANLFRAVDVLLPAATGAEPWPYPELDFRAYAASDIVHAAADAGDREARAAVDKLQAPPGGDLWALRPAVEQLDSIAQG